MKIAVIGMGYVGTSLAEILAQKYPVVGFDPKYAEASEIPRSSNAKHPAILRTARTEDLAGCKVFIICVPTPAAGGKIDLRNVRAATATVATQIRRGGLVIVESTGYPGMTGHIAGWISKQSGLTAGTDFDVGFSSERISPGDPHEHSHIPKMIGGATPDASKRILRLYGAVFNGPLATWSSASIVEFAKLYENTFRAVNIAFVNEIADVCESAGLNFWEGLEIAKTKPFGFMGFAPGPGAGGHCIPVDPYYLLDFASQNDSKMQLTRTAMASLSRRPSQVGQTVLDTLDQSRAGPEGTHVFVIGVAYKPGTTDTRNSPAIKIMRMLLRAGREVSWYDPQIKDNPIPGTNRMRSLEEGLASAYAVVLVASPAKVAQRIRRASTASKWILINLQEPAGSEAPNAPRWQLGQGPSKP